MTNEERAAWGEKAIPAGNPDHEDSMLDKDVGIETSAADTVANILHHVKLKGGDTDRVLSMATSNFEAEMEEAKTDENDEEASPEEERRADEEWAATIKQVQDLLRRTQSARFPREEATALTSTPNGFGEMVCTDDAANRLTWVCTGKCGLTFFTTEEGTPDSEGCGEAVCFKCLEENKGRCPKCNGVVLPISGQFAVINFGEMNSTPIPDINAWLSENEVGVGLTLDAVAVSQLEATNESRLDIDEDRALVRLEDLGDCGLGLAGGYGQ